MKQLDQGWDNGGGVGIMGIMGGGETIGIRGGIMRREMD